jgi:hypothetical protein
MTVPVGALRTHANVTQSMSATLHLPDSYCVKRRLNIRGWRMMAAAQHNRIMAIAIWDYNDAEESEKT